MLASHFPGRIRIVAEALGRKEVSDRAVKLLAGLPGVTGTRLNARAASLVVTYDPVAIDPAGVPALLARYAAMILPGGAPAAKARPGRAVAVLEKKALLGLWVLVLGLILAGNKAGHAATGAALAALTARHVLTRRSTLLR